MQEKAIAIYRGLTAFTIMTITGSTALLLRWCSFGLLTKFNRRYLIAYSSRLILFLIGIRLVLPDRRNYPPAPVLYTFNHNSFLDVLILTALGLTDTTFLLSEKTKKIIPLYISAKAIGILYIPTKNEKERRLQFFEMLEERIIKEQFSLFASSEGPHTFIHGISPFNKGIYHLAIVCQLPVVPVFLNIPAESNPFESYSFKSGTVKVELLPMIQTKGWELDNLRIHVKEMRQLYIDKYDQVHKITIRQ